MPKPNLYLQRCGYASHCHCRKPYPRPTFGAKVSVIGDRPVRPFPPDGAADSARWPFLFNVTHLWSKKSGTSRKIALAKRGVINIIRRSNACPGVRDAGVAQW